MQAAPTDEYEYIDSTPTEGDVLVFLTCLANESDYLAGEEPMPPAFRVHVEHGPHGTFRMLEPVEPTVLELDPFADVKSPTSGRVSRHALVVTNRGYQRSHGRLPRGRGSWHFRRCETSAAFDAELYGPTAVAPAGMTLSAAKSWLRRKGARGVWTVLP